MRLTISVAKETFICYPVPMETIRISSVRGNNQWLDGGAMFGNAPRALWQKWVEVDDSGRIPLACRALLVQTNSMNILLEVGVGTFFAPHLADRFGVENYGKHCLLENLKSKGLEPEQIDYVILSHLHFDHAGGLLPTYETMESNPNWTLNFPNATYGVGAEAWRRAKDPHPRDRASFLPQLNKKLEQSGRLEIIDPSSPPPSLEQHFEFFISNGHTPGQLHTIVKGSSQRVVFAGDLVPGLPWAHIPITMGYDRFPEKVIDEKKELYERETSKNTLFFFTHDHKHSMATLEKNEKGRYIPKDTWNELDQFELY